MIVVAAYLRWSTTAHIMLDVLLHLSASALGRNGISSAREGNLQLIYSFHIHSFITC